MSPVKTQTLGFPRIGPNRELKKAIEGYWSGNTTRTDLLLTAHKLRAENWALQKAAGIELIPSNDFSLYDQVLDHTVLLGCAPERYLDKSRRPNLDEYFAMARGGKLPNGTPVQALEMTKWWDTNYHYLVPQLKEDQDFQLASTKPFDEFQEAKSLGILTKPVLIGPVTFLSLAKPAGRPFDTLALLERLVPVYVTLLQELRRLGAEWVQMDEPILATEISAEKRRAIAETYETLSKAAPGLSILVASYFGRYGDNLKTALELPAQGFHLDLFRAGDELDAVLAGLPKQKTLSLGVVEGRNIWKNDFARSLARIEKAKASVGEARLILSSASSLMHVPVSLEREDALSSGEGAGGALSQEGGAAAAVGLKNWLSFAEEKLGEIQTLARLSGLEKPEEDPAYVANRNAIAERRNHEGVKVPAVRKRMAAIRAEDLERTSPFARRAVAQQGRLGLPAYPVTTIGSFPQTEEVRRARALHKKGQISDAEYRKFLEEETLKGLRLQEDLGIDLLVHGEFERNDMVEFFGEKLEGFAFTAHGWVQSYGSRCVKPPVIFGDVFRAAPMTLDWTVFSSRASKSPVKGMLTGPVTILKWSFVRDDQPLSDTANQIALALRDEVKDLEDAGIAAIQIDEPALREALPLHESEWKETLDWEVKAFKLAAAGVRDETQIHTHMCYCDFGEVMASIAAMDADVISLEASRSGMELLESFREYAYPNAVGPGLWDIHSPRVPDAEEMTALLRRARAVIDPARLWVNPDCGLKTRRWEEVLPSLENMVRAAKTLREEG
ncbi:MAG: 5-methyltetrahydropteroyltriglutamate--homocysteine methyltransferase [Fibrobacteria bacterium]|nr:5-methyltetrahydropteroyltriglutamate--homocysteine methyltransferase [Fibrobacteria bacterium]